MASRIQLLKPLYIDMSFFHVSAGAEEQKWRQQLMIPRDICAKANLSARVEVAIPELPISGNSVFS